MEDNSNIYILVSYIIDNQESFENLRATYPNLIFTRIATGIYTIQVPVGQEAEFEQLQETLKYVNPPLLYGLNASEALEASNIAVLHDYPYGALRGAGILVGFVDTGIDYTNPYFQNADGTSRIVSIWDQTIPSQGNVPNAFGYGSVYSQERINEALRSENPYEIVPSRDENGHGTYLAGVAAGNDQSDAASYTGAAPDAGIIMVKLRPASQRFRDLYLVRDGEPAYQSNDILAGIQYLLNLAGTLNQPLAICIGLGDNYGAHNGTSVIEQYLENIGVTNGIIVVIASGNETNNNNHYKGSISPNNPQTVEINVGEDERGFLLALWANISARLYVSFRSPLGQFISRIPILDNRSQVFNFNLEPTVLDITYIYTDPFTGEEAIAIRFNNPTPGIWGVAVESDVALEDEFHMWLPREGFISSSTYFLQPDPYYTIQIPATAEFTIAVGAYDPIDNSIYVASGRGPTTANVIKPDFLAPGVNVQGPRVGGGLTTYVGTSTAAAITTGAAALLLQWAILEKNDMQMNTRIARGIFIRGARRQDNVTYPNNIEGYGRLDVQNSISEI